MTPYLFHWSDPDMFLFPVSVLRTGGRNVKMVVRDVGLRFTETDPNQPVFENVVSVSPTVKRGLLGPTQQ